MPAKTVLLVAQRPSDYVEMRRCALVLRERGYRIQFCYHCIYGDISPEIPILREIVQFVEDKIFTRGDLVSESHSIFKITLQNLDSVMLRLTRKRRDKKQREREQREREQRAKIKREEAKSENLPAWKRYIVKGIQGIRAVRRGIGKIKAIGRAWAPFRHFINQILTQLFVIKAYLTRLSAYRTYLRRIRPDILILPEDVVGLVTPLLIRAGHERGIPALIVPYTIADQQEAFRSLQTQSNYQARHWVNYPVALLFRSWVMRQKGVKLVRLPAAYIIGHFLTRTSPPDPWMMNSGFANAIAVENRAMFDFYRNAGIPESKMQVVGAPYDDQLAAFVNNKEVELAKLRRELGIANDKPLLVIGGCPDQTGSCPDFEFCDMEDFADHFATALAELKNEYTLIVRPHPNYPQLGDMLSRKGIVATNIDTARLVALSDLYIAFASATIRWAVACGVSTINYDVFHYDYDDFKKVSGVVTVMRYSDFCKTVASMHRHDPARAALAEKARKDAPRWGQLDGKSLDRIVALIETLCASKPVPRTAG